MVQRNDLILRLVEQDLQQEQLAGASTATLRGLRAGRRGGPVAAPKKRIQLAIAQGWRCHWCQQQCREEIGWQNSATLEHVVPRCLGGPNEPWNLVMSCWRCNVAKDSQHWEDFEVRARRFLPDARTVEEVRKINLKASNRRRKVRGRAAPASWQQRMMLALVHWARILPA